MFFTQTKIKHLADRTLGNTAVELELPKLGLIYCRFDTETVSLLAGYEAIFGQEMWRNAIVETTFWSHTKEAARQRKKQMLSEDTRRSHWENDLKTKYQLSEG